MDHIDQAIHSTIHESDIPAKEIAQRLGMSHQVLINKANPQSEFHKMSLREALAVQLITGSTRIHDAMAVELDVNETIPSKSVVDSILLACKEHGDVVSVVHGALEDGRFTLREREDCQREINELITALVTLRESVVKHGTGA